MAMTFQYFAGKNKDGSTTNPPFNMTVPTAGEMMSIQEDLLKQWTPPYFDDAGNINLPDARVLGNALDRIQTAVLSGLSEDQKNLLVLVSTQEESDELQSKYLRLLNLPAIAKATDEGATTGN